MVLTTQCVYWLAHTYSELVGERVTSGQRPRRRQVLHVLRDAWPLMSASFAPLVTVIATWLLGVSANTAVLVGLWAGIAILAGWALFAGRRAKLRSLELLLYALLSGVFGTAILLLKVVLHENHESGKQLLGLLRLLAVVRHHVGTDCLLRTCPSRTPKPLGRRSVDLIAFRSGAGR